MSDKDTRKGLIIKYKKEVKSWFTKVPVSTLYDKKVTDADFRLYALLLTLQYEGREKTIQPEGGVLYTREFIASKLGWSLSSYKRSVSNLENLGYCQRKKITPKLSVLEVLVKLSPTEQAEAAMQDETFLIEF